jgi:dephospho-CoA kinase
MEEGYDAIEDGTLNRERMAQRCFGDRKQLRRLNGMIVLLTALFLFFMCLTLTLYE